MSDESIRPRLRSHYNLEGQHVHDFHTKFLVPMATKPSFLDPQAFEFRMKFLQEELNEFRDGHESRDMHLAADALVDLVYVALGTALMMGVPWKSMWDRVQERNMAKERAKADGSNSKRKSPLDVIKPEGWFPPNHTPCLGHGPWPTFDATGCARMIEEFIKAHPNAKIEFNEHAGTYGVWE